MSGLLSDCLSQEVGEEVFEAAKHGDLETLEQLLRRPETSHRDLPQPPHSLPQEIIEQVEISIKYAGYIDRQEIEARRMGEMESKGIPLSFEYSKIPSLRTEARQKLERIRPGTVGQAGRISGVTPSDLAVVMIWLRRHREEGSDGASD